MISSVSGPEASRAESGCVLMVQCLAGEQQQPHCLAGACLGLSWPSLFDRLDSAAFSFLSPNSLTFGGVTIKTEFDCSSREY